MSVYAITDLHGRMDLYQEVCAFLKPEDKVICLGDCGDRGPAGWELIKAIYENHQWTYLMGNHEHMLFHAMRQYLDGERGNSYRDPISVCYNNGGASTLQGWINEGADREWITRLSKLPRKMEYINSTNIKILLSHAGYSPDDNPTPYNLIWDREHSIVWWPEGYDDVLIVHGHTPSINIMVDINEVAKFKKKNPPYTEFVPGAIWYCQGHKVDLDCGAYFTNHTVLFDLDTLEEHIFGEPKIDF